MASIVDLPLSIKYTFPIHGILKNIPGTLFAVIAFFTKTPQQNPLSVHTSINHVKWHFWVKHAPRQNTAQSWCTPQYPKLALVDLS